MKNKSWVIIAILVILVVGYLVYRGQSGSSYMGYGTPTPTAGQSAMGVTTAPTAITTAGTDIVMTKTDTVKGDYLAGPNGMTLYVFDKDTTGVSNCTGACATLWPPYTTTAAPATLPANITTLTRADGTMQFAYTGKPVYYYSPDKQPGDLTGDGFGGVWHIIKP